MRIGEFPLVLVVSDSCISTAHGTGTIVLRHFSNYPKDKLSNAYCLETGDPAWPRSCRFKTVPARHSPMGIKATGIIARVYNPIVTGLGLNNLKYHRPVVFEPELTAIFNNSSPELVYSVSYSETGLGLTDYLCSGLPAHVPVIQYFLDYHIPPGISMDRYLRRVLNRATEIWAMTEEIAEAIRPLAQRLGKKIKLQPGFHLEMPITFKREHRRIGPHFRCIVLGNFWMPPMAHVLKNIWGRVQARVPGLEPIRWLCHPRGVEEVKKVVGNLGPEIQYAGHFSGEELEQKIADADLAIVPFNASSTSKSNYSRYSLPSRLTELLAIGVPVFCIADATTPLAHYIKQNDLGIVFDGEDEEALSKRLLEFMSDAEARRSASARARQFAKREFQLKPFQDWLYAHLATLAAQRVDTDSI